MNVQGYIFSKFFISPPPLLAEAFFFPKSKRAIEVFPKPIFFPQGIFSEQIFPQTKFFSSTSPSPIPPPFFFPLLCSLFPSIPSFSSFFFSFFLLFSSFFFFFFFFFLFFSLFPFPFPLFSFTPFLQLDISSFFFPGPFYPWKWIKGSKS